MPAALPLSARSRRVRPPELLAPAGTRDAMRAAVENGADGVYFGLGEFNARLRAHDFAVAELPAVVAWLHERGVRAYVTLNTLVFTDELPEAARLLLACSAAGVDGVMVQDLGVARLAAELVPELPIHASTQTTFAAPESLRAAEALGLRFTRLVAPRELDLQQITDLVDGTQAEIEVFVHGALCVAYSGQCLTSEALGGRSANRGECAQACRLPYDLLVDGAPRDLGDVKYLLSPRDLCALSDVPHLIAAGVHALKIEGRLKSAEYVAATVQAFREAIDCAGAVEEAMPYAPDDATRYRLEMVFSRGFTPGYLHRIDHQAVVEGRYPKKRGPFLGRVLTVSSGGATIELHSPLALGDGIVFDAGRPDRDEMGGRVYGLFVGRQKVAAIGPEERFPVVVTVQLARDRFDARRVHAGDRVWKTSDPRLETELAQTWRTQQPHWRRPVQARLRVCVGEPAALTFTDHWGLSVTVTDEAPAEAAHDHAIDEAQAAAQIGRLGNTPFRLADLELEVSAPAYVPVSRLNALRRKAVDALLAARRAVGTGRTSIPDALDRLCAQIAVETAACGPAPPELSVLCRTPEQVAVAATHPAVATIYTDFEDLRQHSLVAEVVRSAGKRFVPATLRVMKPREHSVLRAILATRPDAVLVRNLAAWHLLRAWQPDLPLIGDYALNVANEITAWMLVRAGFAWLTPSYDLNGEQLLDLLGLVPPGWFEVTVHQHMPMFHMEHCVFCRFLSSGNDYTNCGRPCDRHRVALRDRLGYAHPVRADAGCRNTVYNAVAQSAAEYVPQLLAAGVRRFRVEFIEEDSGSTREAIDAYAALLQGKAHARDVWRRLKALSRVGVTRGTLDHA
jgi:putative protease